jgi:hypothetical protein
MLCRALGLFGEVSVAIDGSKFKAVNNRDKNFTRAKMERRMAQIEESVARYLRQLDSTDRQEPSEARTTKTTCLKERIAKLKEEMQRLHGLKVRMLARPDQQISLTDPDSRSMATSGRGSGIVGYNVQVAVDTEHHLIITHEVTNVGSDRAQLARIAKQHLKEPISMLSLTAATSAAKKSWSATTSASRSPCQSRRPRTQSASASRISATWRMRTSTSVLLESGSPTHSQPKNMDWCCAAI